MIKKHAKPGDNAHSHNIVDMGAEIATTTDITDVDNNKNQGDITHIVIWEFFGCQVVQDDDILDAAGTVYENDDLENFDQLITDIKLGDGMVENMQTEI